jgi:hypothetical protein
MRRASWRFWGSVLPAFVLVLLTVGPSGEAFFKASYATLGRDQGIFQYIAWAVGEGELAYRDIRDVNGPVIVLVHALIQALASQSEHGFRVADLAVTSASFLVAGALVPTIVSQSNETFGNKREALVRTIAWSLAAWGVLGAQYVAYGYWDTAQRESFLDWFLLASVTLQAVPNARSRTLWASGALSVFACFGKPTYVLFTLEQLASLLVEEGNVRTRLRRGSPFLLGGLLGAVPPIAVVLWRGDLAAWIRVSLVDVPTMYRFIWPRPALAILTMPGYAQTALLAALTSAGLGLLVGRGVLPRRALPIALMPLVGLLSVVIQAKGFPYHFHPVTLGTWFGWLVALAALSARMQGGLGAGKPADILRWALLLPILCTAAMGGRAMAYARSAPYPEAPPIEARSEAELSRPSRLHSFDRVDFFPSALREAAAYLSEHTRPDERVQLYGMDPYVLFLAKRKSASPFILAYDLNMDAALHGSFEEGGLRPTEAERERIREMRKTHERELLARLQKEPPSAFLFIDRSPLMSGEDAVIDFEAHCPDAYGWMRAHYEEAARFDVVSVWMRRVM